MGGAAEDEDDADGCNADGFFFFFCLAPMAVLKVDSKSLKLDISM